MRAMTLGAKGAVIGASLAALAGSAALAQASYATIGPTVPSTAKSKGVRVIRPDEPATVNALQPSTPVAGPVIKFCNRPFAQPALKLGADLDRRLASELRARKTLVVDLPQPFPERAAPPAALAPWLSEVEAAGGTVTVKQYCSAAKGGLGSWLTKISRVLRGDGKTANPYAAARNYNVVLHADALDRVITQVEFTPKAAPGA